MTTSTDDCQFRWQRCVWVLVISRAADRTQSWLLGPFGQKLAKYSCSPQRKQTLTELSVCGLSGCGALWMGVAWVEDKDIGLEPAPTPMPYWNGCPSPPPKKKAAGKQTGLLLVLLLGAEETIFSSSPIAGDIYPMVIRHRQPLLPLTQQLLTFF